MPYVNKARPYKKSINNKRNEANIHYGWIDNAHVELWMLKA